MCDEEELRVDRRRDSNLVPEDQQQLGGEKIYLFLKRIYPWTFQNIGQLIISESAVHVEYLVSVE